MIGEPAFPLVESLPSESDRVVVAPELYEDSEDDVPGFSDLGKPANPCPKDGAKMVLAMKAGTKHRPCS